MATTELLTLAREMRHCGEYGCRKCAGRARWERRKEWRARKSPNRRKTGRK